MPGVGAWRWNPTGFWNGTWGPDTIGTRNWTIDGEGSFFDLFLDWGLSWGWITKLWRWRAFFVNRGWWMGDVGAFGSLVCEFWKGSGLEPHGRQGMMEGGQERGWFKRAAKGRVWGERNRIRVPVF